MQLNRLEQRADFVETIPSPAKDPQVQVDLRRCADGDGHGSGWLWSCGGLGPVLERPDGATQLVNRHGNEVLTNLRDKGSRVEVNIDADLRQGGCEVGRDGAQARRLHTHLARKPARVVQILNGEPASRSPRRITGCPSTVRRYTVASPSSSIPTQPFLYVRAARGRGSGTRQPVRTARKSAGPRGTPASTSRRSLPRASVTTRRSRGSTSTAVSGPATSTNPGAPNGARPSSRSDAGRASAPRTRPLNLTSPVRPVIVSISSIVRTRRQRSNAVSNTSS